MAVFPPSPSHSRRAGSFAKSAITRSSGLSKTLLSMRTAALLMPARRATMNLVHTAARSVRPLIDKRLGWTPRNPRILPPLPR